MNIKRFQVNPIEENTYIIWDAPTREAAVVDCGAWTKDDRQAIADFISNEGLQLRMALQTHSHFDHIFGAPWLNEQYGLRPRMHALEEAIYYAMPDMVRKFGIRMSDPLPRPDEFLTNGECIMLGYTEIRIQHTPGHTPGGVCFHIPADDLLLTGDTLFRGSVGRTDLPGGNMGQLVASLHRLLTLSAETTVLPGHGPETTIGYEAQYNPFAR
ncbi:MAG: MBL fold metallo-hydrolase [Bacteroidaceae bacterium]|nr:MBL fold metallo-hydrolase [Bacteroidaceae bacterium]